MEFDLAGEKLVARASGALFWPAQGVLCVSDLHLGKSERMARRGGALLPPYEVAETLSKLEADIAAMRPKIVIFLGDSFDDLAAGAGLDAGARLRLTVCQAGRQWVWIEGNHDAGPVDIAGQHLAQLTLGPLTFRHIAAGEVGAECGEISGHYHPKARLAGQSLPAFWVGKDRLILPAYGAYTGGMMAADTPIRALLGGEALALICRSGRVLPVPLG